MRQSTLVRATLARSPLARSPLPRSPLPRAGLGLAAALWLAGCRSPPTRFLDLEVVPPTERTTERAAGTNTVVVPIRVDFVHIPPALDRPELVRQLAGRQLQVNDLDHWGAPLGDLARRVLTQDLLARLPAGVVIFPESPKPDRSAGLNVDILDVGEAEGHTDMDVSWTRVVSGAGYRPEVTTRSARLTTPGGQEDAAALAGAISRLLAQLADRIAAEP